VVLASEDQITRFKGLKISNCVQNSCRADARAYHSHISQYLMYVQVLQQLDAAQGSVEDMDEWLGIFNVKLRHMREDIESVYILS
jgi:hypothetical protein